MQDKIYSRHHPETYSVLKEFRSILDQYPAKISVGEINSEDPAIIASYYGNDNDELLYRLVRKLKYAMLSLSKKIHSHFLIFTKA